MHRTAKPSSNSCGLLGRKVRALIVFVALGIGVGRTVCGEEPIVRSWRIEDGLPEGEITAIQQTPEGYLWVGTPKGVARFDGVRFQVFTTANQPGLASNRIAKLILAHDGTLLLCTEDGSITAVREGQFDLLVDEQQEDGAVVASVMDREGGTILACRSGSLRRWANGKLSSLWKGRDLEPLRPGARRAPGLCQDESNRLWALTADLRLVRFAHGRCDRVNLAGDLSGARCSSLVRDLVGRIWLGTDQGLAVLQGDQFQPVPLSDPPALFAVDSLLACRDGGLWVGSGVRQRKWRNGQWAGPSCDLPIRDSSAVYLGEDAQGRLCVGTAAEGLFRVTSQGQVLQLSSRDGLPGNHVHCLTRDREGSEWLGLTDGGLARVRSRRFQSLTSDRVRPSPPILSVCEDHTGGIWLGSDGEGLSCWQNGHLTRYGRKLLPGRSIAAVLEDSRNELWVGTLDAGCFRFQAGGFVPAVDAALVGGRVTALYEDRRGRLWLGTPAGLIAYEDGRFAAYPGPDVLGRFEVRVMLQDQQDRLWVGTRDKGLLCLKEGRFTLFRRTDGLAHDSVCSLYADSDQSLWVGTDGGGLSRFRDGRFVNFTTGAGLPDDVIGHITQDRRGNFWFSSRKGVFRAAKRDLDAYARREQTIIPCVVYDQSDGLPSPECSSASQPSGWTTRQGRLLIPTRKGVAVIQPDTVEVNPLPPPVLIEELRVDEQILSPRPGVAGPPGAAARPNPLLEIPPGSSRLAIQFTALSFMAPEKVRFRHKLEPLEHDWVETALPRVASYSYLRPGDYQFQLIACNNDGIWNQQGATLAFTVLPHLWQTWWFTGLAAIAVVGAVAAAARSIEARKSRREVERLEQQHLIERERTRIAKDIHDDLGASLTRISLTSGLLAADKNKPDAVELHAGKIAATALETVRSLDEIVWAVNPRHDTLDSLVEYISHYADEFFEGTNVACRLELPIELVPVPLTAEVRHNVFLVVKEALNNLLKHSRASEAHICARLTDGIFALEISDNGTGFAAANQMDRRAGSGLGNMGRRIESIGGRFQVSSKPGQGSTIRISLPLGSTRPVTNSAG